MKLASFDIFDTTLIRRCGLPENVFYLLARKLYPDHAAKRDDFFLWRCGAERQAVSLKKNRQVTLADIYDSPELASFAEYTPQELMEREKEVERENLMPNPAVRQMIADKRAAGFRIVFISDMYLDSGFLADTLRAAGCLEGDEPVFVSCEHGARKSDGALFDTVRQLLHPEVWQHFGDNRHSDVHMPRKKGIQAAAVDTAFTGIERRLLRKSHDMRDEQALSILAGFSRAARIRSGNDAFVTLAADYIAPAYIPYVKFVLYEARREGIRTLYFLSRDSYVLFRLAQRLLPATDNVELRYLFLSRKSLMLPYLAGAGQEVFLEALDRRTVMRKRVSSLLSLLGMDAVELARYGITFAYDKIVNREQEADFMTKIFESPYTPVWQERAASHRQLLLAYLQQEGVLAGQASAMIDVGWLGTSRLMLNAILRRAGFSPVKFFYYGIRGDVLHARYGEYASYFHAGQLTTEATALIEHYFSASPWPTTVGYERRDDGVIQPLFPVGKVKTDTAITLANVTVAEWMAEELRRAELFSDAVLFAWASWALDSITSLKDPLDVTPFTQSDDFDTTSFVRKLSFREWVVLVCTGKPVTAFDRASLQLTCGRWLMPLLWHVRTLTGRIRRRLFLKYVIK